MRAGLEAAAATAPNPLDGYPKGSTVLCAACFVPLYRLERGIAPGEKASRTCDAYRPVTASDIAELRREVPGVKSALMQWTPADVVAHVNQIDRPKTGSLAECPACHKSWVQVFAPEAGEVIDRAYTWRLVTVPPLSDAYPVRSSRVRL